jgi:DNA-binding transcriptional ArsR family regulator
MDVDLVFKALADKTRRRVLDLLHEENGRTLGDLCEEIDLARQVTTKHIALLEEAGLIVTVWRGRQKLHYLNPVPIHTIYERWISKFERERIHLLHQLKKRLEKGNE